MCVQCHSVMNVSSDGRCAFVKKTPDCNMVDGFINYLQVAFCLLPPNLTPLTITLCVRSMWVCLCVYTYKTLLKRNAKRSHTFWRTWNFLSCSGHTFYFTQHGGEDRTLHFCNIKNTHIGGSLRVGIIISVSVNIQMGLF